MGPIAENYAALQLCLILVKSDPVIRQFDLAFAPSDLGIARRRSSLKLLLQFKAFLRHATLTAILIAVLQILIDKRHSFGASPFKQFSAFAVVAATAHSVILGLLVGVIVRDVLVTVRMSAPGSCRRVLRICATAGHYDIGDGCRALIALILMSLLLLLLIMVIMVVKVLALLME